jgi:hypothetical protein
MPGGCRRGDSLARRAPSQRNEVAHDVVRGGAFDVGQFDVNLDVRLISANRYPPYGQTLGGKVLPNRPSHGGIGIAAVQHLHAGKPPFHLLPGSAIESTEAFAARPAPGSTGLQFKAGGPAQAPSHNEQISAPSGASERLQPPKIARFERDDDLCGGEGIGRLDDLELDRGASKPPESGSFPELRKPTLEPSERSVALANVALGSYREPQHEDDQQDKDERRKNGVHMGQGTPTPPQGWRARLNDFLYGMAGYEFAQNALETRRSLETLFMVATVGDMVGLPVIPPYYALRLLPFVVPEVSTWKRRVLRDREFGDDHDFHLHGL